MGQRFANQRLGINLSAGTIIANSSLAVLSNSNGFSFGMQSDGVITAQLPRVAVSAGTTSNSGTIVFSNANGISFGLNGSTVTGSFGPISYFPGPFRAANAFLATDGGAGGATIVALINRTNLVFPLNATKLAIQAENTAGDLTATLRFGVYTFSGSTASLASSTSGSVAVSANANWATLAIGTMNFSVSDYYFYIRLEGAAVSYQVMSVNDLARAGSVPWFDQGVLTTTQYTAPPVSLVNSDVIVSGVFCPIFELIGT